MTAQNTRRKFLRSLAGASLALPVLHAAEPETQMRFDERLLDEIERRACLYFWEMADPNTGLVLDRARADAPYYVPGASSIAATGFGLSALCIAVSRGYIERNIARARIYRTLEFLNKNVDHERGFFYHFIESSTGKRIWRSEASSIDTAWLLCGALHCRAFWDDPEIRNLASALLDWTDWQWMLNGSMTLAHGWTPERGFLPYHWDSYAELLAMYLLAIGSNSNAIPATTWDVFKRPMRDYDGIFYIDDRTPLFVHQYSHAWFDFRNRRDRYADYFRNSQRATQAHRLYCQQLAKQYPWFGPDMWGVTASDSRYGYRVWGAPDVPLDGTLVPCAAGGSLVFLPDSCGAVLENMVQRYGDKVWRKYGFVDAFQPQAEWYSNFVIGINVGITLLMTENARGGSVWEAVMSTPEAQRGMDRAGLRLMGKA